MSSNNQTLGFGIKQYRLCLDNREIENSGEDRNPSSAANFLIELHPTLEISNLLFLKSTEAEICLRELTIDNSCLTFSHEEYIECYVKLNSDKQNFNFISGNDIIQEWDEKPMKIHFSNFSATNNNEAIEYLQSRIRHNVNYRIVHAYLMNFLDQNIFEDDFIFDVLANEKLILQRDEIKLILRWIDITFHTRKIIYNNLIQKITAESKPGLTPFRLNNARHAITKSFEENVLAISNNLHTVQERELTLVKLIDFSLFYDIDLAKTTSAQLNSINNSILSQLNDWIDLVQPDDISKRQIFFNDLIESNNIAIQQGIFARNIIRLERDREEKLSSNLFQLDFLEAQIDESKQKIMFKLNHRSFLSNDTSSVSILFPEHASYVLGSNDPIIIGPISANTPTYVSKNPTIKLLTNNIISSHQRLPSCIRSHPRMLHIMTDLVSRDTRSFWTTNMKKNDCYVLDSILIDQEMKLNHFISKQFSEESNFHRLNQSKHILDSFKISIVDENFRSCKFSRCSYVTFVLTIRPVCFDY